MTGCSAVSAGRGAGAGAHSGAAACSHFSVWQCRRLGLDPVLSSRSYCPFLLPGSWHMTSGKRRSSAGIPGPCLSSGQSTTSAKALTPLPAEAGSLGLAPQRTTSRATPNPWIAAWTSASTSWSGPRVRLVCASHSQGRARQLHLRDQDPCVCWLLRSWLTPQSPPGPAACLSQCSECDGPQHAELHHEHITETLIPQPLSRPAMELPAATSPAGRDHEGGSRACIG